MMLPPPQTTMPVSTPARDLGDLLRGRWMRSVEIPQPCSPARLWPETLSEDAFVGGLHSAISSPELEALEGGDRRAGGLDGLA